MSASSAPPVPSASPASEGSGAVFQCHLFDGTSGAFGPDDSRTVIQFLWRLLNAGTGSSANYVKGVATGGNWVLRGLKGFVGSGFDAKVVDGLRDIFAKWHPRVKIILLGYSRGGVEACVVSNILSIIGIPQTTQLQGSVKDFAQIVYETYIAGDLDAEKTSLEHQYKCRPVEVEALICFDNVGIIGVPRTGILKPLSLFKAQKNPGFDGRLRGNIRNAVHAVALHESRKPYTPTLLYKSPQSACELVNMVFPGTHSHAGKHSATENAIEGLYLGWAISVLKKLGVPMREEMLRERFPHYHTGVNVAADGDILGQNVDGSYARGDISPRHSMVMKIGTVLLGQETRNPSRWLRDNMEANIQFHASLRAHDGVTRVADPVLSAFAYNQTLDGGSYSDRSTFSTPTSSPSPSRATTAQSSITSYPEAKLTPVEKNLHGICGIPRNATI